MKNIICNLSFVVNTIGGDVGTYLGEAVPEALSTC